MILLDFRKYLFIAVFVSCFNNLVNAQTALQHQEMIGDNSRLFNGLQYAGYPFIFTSGHQFFDTTVAIAGTIVYDDVFYPNVHLQYDLISDLVIVQHKFRRIELANERISGFTLMNHRFTRVLKDSSSQSSIGKEGFYEVIYAGKVQVLKKEGKEIVEELTSDQGILRRIITRENYFICKDHRYHAVTNKKDVMVIYKDKKKEIRDYIKNSGLSFRNNRADAIKKVSVYYDQITK